MSIKYNVYYATTADGPWTLANNTPIDHSDSGNSYTITGLREDTQYYICVVGGEVVSNVFYPYISQPIGPNQAGVGDVSIYPPSPIIAKTFSPPKSGTDSLSHQFTVV